MKRLLILFASAAALAACHPSTVLTSPDGRNALAFDPATMTYAVLRDGDTLVRPSALGIAAHEVSFSGFRFGTVRRTSADREWSQPWGENKHLRDHYREMTVELHNIEDRIGLTLRFRAYDDGVAWRYELDAPDSLAVTDELTEFRFADEAATLSWSIPGNFETYELQYRELPVAEVADANTPFTFRTARGIYGSIHEAALYDWPEMVLRRDGRGVLKADLAPLPDGIKAYIPGRFTTPWRTIQLGDKAVDLIHSSLILNLNEPSKIADTSWIVPQKYVGVWWGMHLGTQVWTMGPRHGATTENALRHIDFAAANDIQGVLFEGWNRGWENWGGSQHFDYAEPYADFDLERIAAYAREKGVELWMHAETGGNIPEFEEQMERAFARYAELGVRTLKTGYAGGFKGGYLHHSQYGVKHYQRVVETAARYGIMLDVHEPIKETGIRRTWPNMMTREGARGMEWNAWSEGNSAEYLCTLPFVRLLSGPMDYTPGIFEFDLSTFTPGNNSIIPSTICGQLALYVTLYSPLQMACDLPEHYARHLDAFQFIKEVPVEWERSVYLEAEPMEYVTVARKDLNSDNWFVGSTAGENDRRSEISLDFLDPGRKYEATIYADAPDANTVDGQKRYTITTRKVNAKTRLRLDAKAGGGYAISIKAI